MVGLSVKMPFSHGITVILFVILSSICLLSSFHFFDLTEPLSFLMPGAFLNAFGAIVLGAPVGIK